MRARNSLNKAECFGVASGQTWLLVAAGENWQIELVEAVKAEVKSRKLKKLSLMIMTSRFFFVSKSEGNEQKNLRKWANG